MPVVIPTLFINQMEVSSPQDIAAYLLKFLIQNPGWTSSQIEDTLLSMRKFVASSAEDISGLPDVIRMVFNIAIEKYFPGYSVRVSTTRQTETTYALTISILDGLQTPVLTTEDFVIENGEFMLKSQVRDIAIERN